MRRDSSFEPVAQLRDQLALVAARRVRKRRRPVAPHLELAPGTPHEEVSGGKLTHILEDAVGVGHVAEGEIFHDRARCDAQRRTVERIERPQLRAEDDPLPSQGIAERLHAGAVARHEQALPAGVPDREREHTVQPSHHIDAVLLVEMDEHLGVAARGKAVAGELQLATQGVMVVNLAVEDDGNRAVLVGNRLVTPGNVDDAQTPHAQRYAWRNKIAIRIGTAMRYGIAHGADAAPSVIRRQLDAGKSCYAAHLTAPAVPAA